MKNTRILTIVLTSLLCVSILAGCGGNSASVKDDVAVSTIADAVDSAIGKDDGSMVAVDAAYIAGSMQMDASGFEDYIVKINAYGANVDEYGIIKGKDSAAAKEIASQIESYLKMRNDTWMTEYMPEEHPKMQAASFVTVGNYVMYAVLDDDVKKTAFDTFESCLKG